MGRHEVYTKKLLEVLNEHHRVDALPIESISLNVSQCQYESTQKLLPIRCQSFFVVEVFVEDLIFCFNCLDSTFSGSIQI